VIAPTVRRCPCCGHISTSGRIIDVWPRARRGFVICGRCERYWQVTSRLLRLILTLLQTCCFAIVTIGFFALLLLALAEGY
jgi:hypothetical protein